MQSDVEGGSSFFTRNKCKGGVVVGPCILCCVHKKVWNSGGIKMFVCTPTSVCVCVHFMLCHKFCK
jgi:hypothetical protein